MSIENQEKQHSKKITSYIIPVCIILNLFFMHCSPGKMAGTGGKYKYDRFHSSDFPAFVEAIIFSAQDRLSASAKLKWGNWTISFPQSGSPVAKSGGGGDMYMTGLIASNPVQGEFPCAIQCCIACAYTGDQANKKLFIRRCRILIGSDAIADVDYTKRTFGTIIVIDCPIDVQLKQ